MAGSKSNYMEDKVLNLLRGTTFTAPASVYVGLMTTAPGESGAGTEVSGGAYARQAITFAAPSGGSVSNNADINFPTPTADWGTVVGWGIFDASSTGNMLYYFNLAANQTINIGNVVQFLSGQLAVTED
jgi:hypothetical protein